MTTKQQRKTAKRKARQHRAWQKFKSIQRDPEVITRAERLSPKYLSERGKQQLVEEFGDE
jgi:hypothetical protein